MNRRGLGVLFGLIAAKFVLFALLIPPFLGNDEPNHFAYVLVMSGKISQPRAEEKVLSALGRDGYWRLSEMPPPPPDAVAFSQTSLMQHSEDFIGTRSPLYYWVAALPLRVYLPDSVEDALFVSRLVSVLISMTTVFIVYRCGVVFFGPGGAGGWLAAAVVGLHPQFSYLGAVVNSDVLMYFLFSAAFLWMLEMVARAEISAGWLVGFFMLAAVSLLAKKHSVLLIPAAFCAVALAAPSWRAALRGAALFAALLLITVLALEYLAPDSMVKMVDRLGLTFGYSFAGPSELAKLTAGQWLRGFSIMFVTAWFTWGQMVVKQGAGFYLLYGLLCAAAAAGVLRGSGPLFHDGRLGRRFLAALVFFGLVTAMNVLTFFTPGLIHLVSGRYLFYGIAPAALLFTHGALELCPQAKGEAARLTLLIFLALNLVAVFGYLLPVYHG